MTLSVIENSREIHLLDESLYALGEDQILRKYNLRESKIIDSLHLGEDFVSVDVVSANNSIYHLFQFSNLMMWFREGESLASVDTLFTHSHALFGPIFPVLQRFYPNSGLTSYLGDPAVESVEILDSLRPEDCSGDYCEFDYQVAAISEVTVRNVGDLTVQNFTYYNNSTGGFFCFTGRNSKYFEIVLHPGETFTFRDTIGAVGTVRKIPYHAFSQVPDHRL